MATRLHQRPNKRRIFGEVCFNNRLAVHLEIYHHFSRQLNIFRRDPRHLRLRVLLAEQPRTAVHQLRQRKAAAALRQALLEGDSGRVRQGGAAVDGSRVH